MIEKVRAKPMFMLQKDRFVDNDHESNLLASLSTSMLNTGYSISQVDLTNFYVALKSKPLVILVNQGSSGEAGLVETLAQSLLGRDLLRVQVISGHPWWAEGSKDLASNTQLHERFLTDKLLSTIIEASQPENAQKIFIACLKRISPAELLSFFTEVAFQLQHGQLMRVGDAHFSAPLPYPPNLFMVGTMDTPAFQWWDKDLLQKTTVIQWSYTGAHQKTFVTGGHPLSEIEFMESCIRNRDSAYRKLAPVLKIHRHPLRPLLRVESLLDKYAFEPMDRINDEVMIYLANSWSITGKGLFHLSPARNLMIALDMAMAQIVLPRAVDAIQSIHTLRKQLEKTMSNLYPRSAAFVSSQITA